MNKEPERQAGENNRDHQWRFCPWMSHHTVIDSEVRLMGMPWIPDFPPSGSETMRKVVPLVPEYPLLLGAEANMFCAGGLFE